jgi:Uma2 family endonuclease
MATVATKKVWTDEELMRIKHEGKVELVDGEVKLMTPAGGLEQVEISMDLLTRLNNYVRRHKVRSHVLIPRQVSAHTRI